MLHHRTGLNTIRTLVKTGPKILRTGTEAKFRHFVDSLPINISSMKYALKSVPGLADVEVLPGDGDGPVTLALGSGSKKCAYHVDQHKELKGLDV